ncbi:MAG: iron-containing alcohol dehydrogenase [Myxococcales bacterium]|nr:iron-containing alcohol dehydrogenase [Myxococcales bacterium]
MPNEHDRIFEIATSRLRFGVGATREIGHDCAALGATRALVLCDPGLRGRAPVESALDALRRAGIDAVLFDRVRVEPSDRSMLEAVVAARDAAADVFVAVGGGSTIDTAKVANRLAAYPADLIDVINAPIGGGRRAPGPLKPLIAVPTTAGTGSEVTAVAVLDLEAQHLKTGISDPRMRPTLGIIDPENTRELPPAVAAASGLDVLCHAIESYTALPYDARPRPRTPAERPSYQGANPVSDLWSLTAIRLAARYLRRAVADPDDLEARQQMLFAAAYAGMGFGHAGVHLPHAMSYPIAGMVRDFRAPGYPADHPLIPHGISVITSAPAVFRFTAEEAPARHLDVLRALAEGDPTHAPAGHEMARAEGLGAEGLGEAIAGWLTVLMRDLGLPNGLTALGYGEGDIPALVEGTLAQARLTKLSPRTVDSQSLGTLFRASMRNW